jgi:DNA-binding response OmpR family regulator
MPAVADLRILFVEDNADLADLVVMCLEGQGATVRAARNVADALAQLDDGRCDVAVLDINLDGEACWPIVARLRTDGVPFLLVSGYGDAFRDQAPDAVHVAKPYSVAALVAAIGTLVGR